MGSITDVDIIILSYAQNAELKRITEQCICTLLASESRSKINFQIIVVESEKILQDFQYEGTTTIYPDEEFSYNRYLNIGIANGTSRYICLCNNDLIFHPHWATEILKSFYKYKDLSSASPFCSIHHPKMGFERNNGIYPGYRSRYELAGWCIFMKRQVLDLVGKLDENFKFWCADNDLSNMLSVLDIKHALVSTAMVDHLDGATFDLQSKDKQDELTAGEFFYFEKKWNYRMEPGEEIISNI
jgi:hypothetical protein